jgi:hypothetical protein
LVKGRGRLGSHHCRYKESMIVVVTKVEVVEVIGSKGHRVVWLGEAWHSYLFVMGGRGG